MITNANRILVIRGGAISDFILTLPAVAALRQQFPQSWLEVIGYRQIVPLALLGGLANGVREIEAQSMAGFFALGGKLDPGLGRYFSSFALIVSYLFDPHHIFKTNLARVSEAQIIQGPFRPDDTGAIHATEAFLKPLERLAIFDGDVIPRLSIDPQPSSANCFAFHPGGRNDRQIWPEKRWADLLDLVMSLTDHDVLLVGSDAEEGRLQRLIAPLPPDRVQLALHLPLADLAARLAPCRAFVGHNSGITHLAASVGLPVLALWTEPTETVWGPRGRQIHILPHYSGLAGLTARTVLERLLEIAV